MTTLLWVIGAVFVALVAVLVIVLCGAARLGDEMSAEAWRAYVERMERNDRDIDGSDN